MRVDAHLHFWRYSPEEYGWIDDSMPSLQRDYLPEDLVRAMSKNGLTHGIAVQARQSLEETRWLLGLAQKHDAIAGVVGWVDLCEENLELILNDLRTQKLVGLRHILQSEADDRYMVRNRFVRGLQVLERLGFTYDLLVFPRHLPIARELLPSVPRLKVVIDHCAKPLIKAAVLEPWASDLRELAAFPNVFCKLSGLVTEADWTRWSVADLQPYVEVVLEAFGAERVMFGSDWPVCLVASGYDRWVQCVRELVPHEWHDDVFGNTAKRFYGLS